MQCTEADGIQVFSIFGYLLQDKVQRTDMRGKRLRWKRRMQASHDDSNSRGRREERGEIENNEWQTIESTIDEWKIPQENKNLPQHTTYFDWTYTPNSTARREQRAKRETPRALGNKRLKNRINHHIADILTYLSSHGYITPNFDKFPTTESRIYTSYHLTSNSSSMALSITRLAIRVTAPSLDVFAQPTSWPTQCRWLKLSMIYIWYDLRCFVKVVCKWCQKSSAIPARPTHPRER